MTVEVLPRGTQCNLACKMCFQNPIRDAGNQAGPGYNMAAMQAGLERENYHFTLFGGEALLTPVEDLEELWKFGLEKFGQNGIQTSGSIVTEKHHELFKKYKVSVGVSLEGPGSLNDIRWAGSLERTRETTARVEGFLHRLLKEGRPPSLITTLNRGNASPERLPRLVGWFRELDALGLRHVNLHLMEVDDPALRGEWTLTAEENARALLACLDLQAELGIKFQPLTDMVGLLTGDDKNSNCIWNACDPYTTRAVRGINGAGDSINCSRTNKDGVDHEKAAAELLARPVALYHADQAAGGCKGCSYWFACKGNCPGESINGDWRMKTEHCETLKIVFEELEGRLASLGLEPISRSPGRRARVEKRLLEAFSRGEELRIFEALSSSPATPKKNGHGDAEHGDHNDAERPVKTHGDSYEGEAVPEAGHGDAPHQDTEHGDHTDAERPVKTHGDSYDEGAKKT